MSDTEEKFNPGKAAEMLKVRDDEAVNDFNCSHFGSDWERQGGRMVLVYGRAEDAVQTLYLLLHHIAELESRIEKLEEASSHQP